ncbi:MAG TPA: amidohydrolase family protein [Chitinophagaceae bacterium]|nr:amidohydrolase family protein [Chitinophagaceae bacterium]
MKINLLTSLVQTKKNSCWLIALFLIGIQINAQQFTSSVKQFIIVNSDTVALTHAAVVDGTGSASKMDQTIIIIKGRIAEVGSSTRINVSKSAKVIDCTGKTIIPGMVMMHEHLFYGESVGPYYLGLEMPVSFPRLYLAGGATTIRTTGSTEPQTDLNLKKWIDAGRMAGPDIDVTGPYIEREFLPIPEIQFIKTPEDAEKEVEYWISKGSTSFKVYMDITKDDLKAVVTTAHKSNLKVTGHLCSITYREAATLGIDNLEHGFIPCSDFVEGKKENVCAFGAVTPSLKNLDVNSEAMKDLMKFLIEKKVALTSTLPVFEPYTGREVIPGNGDAALAPQVMEAVRKNYDASVRIDSSDAALFKKEMAWEKQFVEMGGRLMAGVDPTGAGRTIPGYADRHVLELLVEAGFTFAQAVKICSLNAAEYLGREKEIGTISEGKRADLVLINGNPEKDIKTVRNTEIVFKNGVGYDSKKLFDSVNGKVGLY